MAKLVFNIRPAATSNIGQMTSHELARTPDGKSKIDRSRTHLNRVLFGPATQQAAVDQLFASGVQRPAAQAETPYLQMAVGAGPEFFRPEKPQAEGEFEQERVDTFEREAMTWLRNTFGHDLVHASLHLDEVTPHIHVLVVPTYGRKARRPGRKKRGESDEQFEERKREAEARPPVRTVGRSSNPLLAREGSYTALRRSLANHLEHLGIEYGDVRELDAPAPRTTAEWLKEEAANRKRELAEVDASLEQSRLEKEQLEDEVASLAASPLPDPPTIPAPDFFVRRASAEAWAASQNQQIQTWATEVAKGVRAKERKQADADASAAKMRQQAEAAQKEARAAESEARARSLGLAFKQKDLEDQNKRLRKEAELGRTALEKLSNPRPIRLSDLSAECMADLASISNPKWLRQDIKGEAWSLFEESEKLRAGTGVVTFLNTLVGSLRWLVVLARHFDWVRVGATLDRIKWPAPAREVSPDRARISQPARGPSL